MRIPVADIARMVGGEFVGDGNVPITGCAGVGEAKSGDITFLANPKYLSQAQATQASAVLIPRNIDFHPSGREAASFHPASQPVLIRVENPSLAFSKVLEHFAAGLAKQDGYEGVCKGIDRTAVVSAKAQIGKNVSIGAYSVVEDGAVIGENTVIYPHCYVGAGSSLGRDCLIYPMVTVRERISIGNRVIIHSGSVIGSDGFGYVTVSGKHLKVPQIGTVLIEDDVEIGANVTIDRARFDRTVIGEGTKIDNLVQIGHNVVAGRHCIIVSQAGVSGSTKLGNYVVLAGQAGVTGHLTVGDGAVVAAQSGLTKSIKAGEQVFGSPAQPIKEAYRAHAHVQRLQQYVETIRDLKRRIEALERSNGGTSKNH